MPQQSDIRIRRDTATNWATTNPILNSGELGLEVDTLEIKVGDGVTAWTALKYHGDSYPAPFLAPPGWLQPPSHAVGTAAVAFTAAANGKMTLVPFDVGPLPQRYTAQAVGVTTQQVAGTGSTVRTGIYRTRNDGVPDLAFGPLATTTNMNLLATGWRYGALDITLPPGRYWNAFLWFASAAPSQYATVYGINPGLMLPHVSTLAPGTAVRGYSASGLSALPTTQIALANEGGSTAVAVYCQTPT